MLKIAKDVVVIGLLIFLSWLCFSLYTTQKSLKDQITAMESNSNAYNNMFRTLADSMSAQSKIVNVELPNFIDKLFNTQTNKIYKQTLAEIPQVIKSEIARLNLPPSTTTTINKSSILLQGDSVVYYNQDGVITKTAKVIPVNNDSSVLVIVPQEIEIIEVATIPDRDSPDSMHVYLSAFNKTTGDTLKVMKSLTYVLPGKRKPWNFGWHPMVGIDYSLTNKEMIFKGGINPIIYNGKYVYASFLGLELGYGIKNSTEITLNLVELNLKPKNR